MKILVGVEDDKKGIRFSVMLNSFQHPCIETIRVVRI